MLAFTGEMEYLKGCILLLISHLYLEILLWLRRDACVVRAGVKEYADLSTMDLQCDYSTQLFSASVSSSA